MNLPLLEEIDRLHHVCIRQQHENELLNKNRILSDAEYEEQLATIEAEVREKCAVIAENFSTTDGYLIANAIRRGVR